MIDERKRPDRAGDRRPLPTDAGSTEVSSEATSTFLAEIEQAASTLRRLPGLPAVPELPFDPSWNDGARA